MKQVKPRPWMTLLKGMFYGGILLYLIRLPFLILGWAKGVDPIYLYQSVRDVLNTVSWAPPLVLAAFCGLFRSAPYHPMSNPRYLAFLESSPWNHKKPLPLGPVLLQLPDWIIVLAWTGLIALCLNGNPLYVPMVFLTAYLVATLSPLLKTDQDAPALILVVGLAAVIRFWQQPIVATALLLGLYLIAVIGVRRSLQSFPWPKNERQLVTNLGWPLQSLGPRRKDTQVSFGNALAVAFLVAGWVHAIMSHTEPGASVPDDPMQPALILGLIGVVFFLVRWLIYVNGYASPLTLRGRLYTGRLIIPRHDGAFWAAASLPVIAAATQGALSSLGWQNIYSVPLAVFVLVFSSLALPPDRRRWQLTGEHRMTFPVIPSTAPAESQIIHA